MNRVRNRAWIMLVFLLALVAGICFFLYEYWTQSPRWASFQGSPHVFSSTSVGRGTFLDREGTLLLDATDGRQYSDDSTVRKSMLHWLGDREGHIQTKVLSHYAAALAGHDRIQGVYGYTDTQGVARLTVSARAQAAALKALDGRKGTVAVYNYRTGQILCAVSAPTYDPDKVPDIAGDTSGKYEGVYLNRFLQSTYPPGSIFKIVTTAAALDSVEGIQDMEFTCEASYELSGSRVTCERAHGKLDIKEALAVSCNCSFAQISLLVGSDTLAEYVQKFRITDSVSFDGVTTAEGNFDLAGADKVALAWSAIGQYTDMVNPCRYMTFLGAIAAGGRAAVPYLVEQVTADGEGTYWAETRREERIMSEELAATLREYLRNNVETVYGAGKFPGLTVCAKSGTSELGGGKRPNAMFAGFVTDEEYPLAFIVVVENGGYGATACIPVLSKVLTVCKDVMDGR